MRSLSLALALVVVLGVRAADAQTTDAAGAEAQRHWTAGMAHFQLEEWDDAIKEWEAGFRLKPVPQFLYNIAQAYRQSKRYDKALSFYRKYLRMQPDAPNRAEVEGHVKTLDKLVAEQQKATSKPPVQPLPSSPAPEQPAIATAPAPTSPPPPPTETPPAATPAAPAVAPAPAHADLTATATPRKQPVTKKAWFWGVVAGAVVVAAAAVTVGVVLGTADSTKTLPMVRF
jgi:iron complex outermembrane recepter protein